MITNHVILVFDLAVKLAEKYGANKDLAGATGMLHDVADAVMKREDPIHEEKTMSSTTVFLIAKTQKLGGVA